MKAVPLLSIVFLPLLSSCALWKAVRPLSNDEERKLEQYIANSKQYYDGGHYLQALQQAQKGLEIDDSEKRLLFVLAWTHLKLDTRDDIWKSEEIFNQIDSKPWFGTEDWGTTLGHGLALRRQGDFLEAAAEVAQKEALKDPSKESLVERAHEEAKEKYEEAADKLERALELNPDGTDSLDGLQQIYALQGNYDKSLQYGKRFIDVASRSRQLWEKQLTRPEIGAAEEKLIRQKIDSNRKREVASRSLAASFLYKQKRFPEALEQLDVVLTLDPEKPEEYFNRALCKEGAQEYAGAILDLETFLKKTKLGYESPQVRKAYDLIAQYNGQVKGNARP